MAKIYSFEPDEKNFGQQYSKFEFQTIDEDFRLHVKNAEIFTA